LRIFGGYAVTDPQRTGSVAGPGPDPFTCRCSRQPDSS
jgi:hypothetical protein